MAADNGVNVILGTLADPFQGEHESELFDALQDTFHGLGRKSGEQLHDCALQVQCNVRELAKQGVRLPDQVQGFPSTTSGEREHASPHCHHDTDGQQLVFWGCEEGVQTPRRRASEEHDAHKSHTVNVSQAKDARAAKDEQEGDTDVETAPAALNEDNDTNLEETDVQEMLLAYKESRHLRGEQRVNRGSILVTGRTNGGKPY